MASSVDSDCTKRPCVILKIGTSTLIDDSRGVVRLTALARIAEVAFQLRNAGWDVVLVSSGAVGVGATKLGLMGQAPPNLATKQAMAAVGQAHLVHLYDTCLASYGQLSAAQVLLSAETLTKQSTHSNAVQTMQALIDFGVVPIVNENDTTAHHKIRVGDNDTLSSLVAGMLAGRSQSETRQPTVLLLITDVDGLFTANPSVVSSAAPIRHLRSEDITQLRQRMMSGVAPLCSVNSDGTAEIEAEASTPSAAAAEDTGGAGSAFGTGGMQTKLQAAALASASGVLTGIVNNTRIEEIPELLRNLFPTSAPEESPGPELIKRIQALDHGTWCLPSEAATTRMLSAHKRWLLSIPPMGRITVDAGASKALLNKHSLYAAGCTHVHGVFNSSDVVRVMDESQVEIARALVSYSSAEMRELLGQHSGDIEELLGHSGPESVAHRTNIVLLAEK